MALSANDSRVLTALFDPESSPSGTINIDTTASAIPGLTESECAALASQESAILRPLDTAHPSPDLVAQTHTALSDLLSRNPGYAPAYIDRAQLLRLTLDTSQLFHADFESQSRQLLSDLGQGIALATPASPALGLSALQTRVLAAAHTHRGLLLLRVADLRTRGQAVHGAEALVAPGMTGDEVEALASGDFAAGGRYGNRIAKGLAVRTNPYAKMCGAIVREAIAKEVAEAEGMLREGFVART